MVFKLWQSAGHARKANQKLQRHAKGSTLEPCGPPNLQLENDNDPQTALDLCELLPYTGRCRVRHGMRYVPGELPLVCTSMRP